MNILDKFCQKTIGIVLLLIGFYEYNNLHRIISTRGLHTELKLREKRQNMDILGHVQKIYNSGIYAIDFLCKILFGAFQDISVPMAFKITYI